MSFQEKRGEGRKRDSRGKPGIKTAPYAGKSEDLMLSIGAERFRKEAKRY